MPTVPSFETCKRLAAHWDSNVARSPFAWWWWREGCCAPQIYPSGASQTRGREAELVIAPDIAEMLAEMERRRWGFTLERCHVLAKQYHASVGGCSVIAVDPTEALALALGKALEYACAREPQP